LRRELKQEVVEIKKFVYIFICIEARGNNKERQKRQ
jgi:hypothetical protein